MANLQKLIDLDGLGYFLGQIKVEFVRSVNGVKPDSKGNINIANMTGATYNSSGRGGLVPIPTAGKQDMALCGDATFKVLPIAGGGTGAIDATTACSNLGAIGYKTNIGSIKSIAGCFWADDASGISKDELPKEIGDDDFVLLQIGGKGGQDKHQFLFDASLGIYCRRDDFTLGNEEWSVNDWDRFAYPSEIRGMIFPFAGNSTIPTGFLPCDGSAVSRTTYAKLFAVIGTTYGAGDGKTTFTLPNLIDRFLEGSSAAGSYVSAGLPNFKGTFRTDFAAPTGHITSQSIEVSSGIAATTRTNTDETVTIDLSKASSIYGNSSTVQPPALTMRYIIKY
jgi:microcystin-dependent protein|nr:MAG TPA: tail collar fiber protein [Caudoviricetes sp.]